MNVDQLTELLVSFDTPELRARMSWEDVAKAIDRLMEPKAAKVWRAFRYNRSGAPFPPHTEIAQRMEQEWPELFNALEELQRDF